MFQGRFVLAAVGLMAWCSGNDLFAQTRIDPSRAAEAVPGRREAPILPGTSFGEAGELAPSTPGDSDIGRQVLLERDERYKAFSVWLDSSAFWTDNAANLDFNEQDDWFYAGGVTLSWQPRLTDWLYLDTYVDQHWYRYNELSVLDYEVGEGGAGFLIPLPNWWNTLWHVHYSFQRITQDIGDDPVYQAHSLNFGVQKSIPLNYKNRIDLALLGSLAMDAEPSVLARHEYSLVTGWNYKITRELTLSFSYRLGYYDYYNLLGREDLYHNFGVTLAYQPKPWCEIAAAYNYTLNDSNLDAFDYQAHLTGPSVRVSIRF